MLFLKACCAYILCSVGFYLKLPVIHNLLTCFPVPMIKPWPTVWNSVLRFPVQAHLLQMDKAWRWGLNLTSHEDGSKGGKWGGKPVVGVRAPSSKWCGLLTSARELPAPWGEVAIFVDPLGIVGKGSHTGCGCRMAEVAWQSVCPQAINGCASTQGSLCCEVEWVSAFFVRPLCWRWGSGF